MPSYMSLLDLDTTNAPPEQPPAGSQESGAQVPGNEITGHWDRVQKPVSGTVTYRELADELMFLGLRAKEVGYKLSAAFWLIDPHRMPRI